jgi:hypothetical protein
MLIYGWASKTLKTARFKGDKCSNCQSEERFIIVSASYAHIFWIPLFPYKKSLEIGCASCSQTYAAKNASDDLKGIAKKLKASVKTPWYLYSGLIIVALLIGLFVFQDFQQKQEYKSYLSQPQKDDIYTLYDAEETTEYKYYLWKVIEVNGDSVNIAPNSFQYNMSPTKLDQADGFYDIYYTYHKDYLINLFEEGALKQVQRGLGFGTGFGREIPYVLDSASTDDF